MYSLVGNTAKFLTIGSMTVVLKAMPCRGSGNQTTQGLVHKNKCHACRFCTTWLPPYKNQMPCLQILYNLVGNSAKFTTDGSITVMLKAMPCSEPGKEFVQLSVRDTGCGISKEKQRDMFVPFGQVVLQSV